MKQSGDDSVTITRCDPAVDKLALALAAQAWPDAERAAHWQTIGAKVRGGRAGDIFLLAAWQDQQLLAALLAQALPGKSAVVWPPQLIVGEGAERSRLAALLLAELGCELAKCGVQIAQTLLSCDDRQAALRMEQSGFTHAADLLYLAAAAESFPDHPLALPFAMEPFEVAAESRLARLIDRTYQGTLDCPRIDGLRDTADVLAGYQAVGQLDPDLWQIAKHAGKDVGCVLVNLHPDVNHAEIVYLGVVPEARGRGWGLDLTRHAQWLAREVGCGQMVLAVDAANQPAICMYAAAGFAQWDQKAVWIRPLR